MESFHVSVQGRKRQATMHAPQHATSALGMLLCDLAQAQPGRCKPRRSRPRDPSARRRPFHRQHGPIRQAPRRPALPVASVRADRCSPGGAEHGPSAWCHGGRRPRTGALVAALIIAKAIGSCIDSSNAELQCRRFARRLGKCRAKASFRRENSRTNPVVELRLMHECNGVAKFRCVSRWRERFACLLNLRRSI